VMSRNGLMGYLCHGVRLQCLQRLGHILLNYETHEGVNQGKQLQRGRKTCDEWICIQP
jgi:hypothetical protein